MHERRFVHRLGWWRRVTGVRCSCGWESWGNYPRRLAPGVYHEAWTEHVTAALAATETADD